MSSQKRKETAKSDRKRKIDKSTGSDDSHDEMPDKVILQSKKAKNEKTLNTNDDDDEILVVGEVQGKGIVEEPELLMSDDELGDSDQQTTQKSSEQLRDVVKEEEPEEMAESAPVPAPAIASITASGFGFEQESEEIDMKPDISSSTDNQFPTMPQMFPQSPFDVAALMTNISSSADNLFPTVPQVRAQGPLDVTAMMKNMFDSMQKRTSDVINAINNNKPSTSAPPPKKKVMTSTTGFLRFMNIYIGSLNCEALNDLRKNIDKKIETIGPEEESVSVDRLRLAIQAAVAILTT